jgi:hypothetical protein
MEINDVNDQRLKHRFSGRTATQRDSLCSPSFDAMRNLSAASRSRAHARRRKFGLILAKKQAGNDGMPNGTAKRNRLWSPSRVFITRRTLAGTSGDHKTAFCSR